MQPEAGSSKPATELLRHPGYPKELSHGPLLHHGEPSAEVCGHRKPGYVAACHRIQVGSGRGSSTAALALRHWTGYARLSQCTTGANRSTTDGADYAPHAPLPTGGTPVKGALDVHRLLLEADIAHEIIPVRRAVLSAADIPDSLGLPPAACLAVRLVAGSIPGGSPVALVHSVDSVLHFPSVLRRLQATAVRLLGPFEVSATTEFYAGLVAPVCLPVDIPIYADYRAGRCDVVYTPVGDTGAVLGIRSRDLVAFIGVRFASLCTVVSHSRPAGVPDPGLAATP